MNDIVGISILVFCIVVSAFFSAVEAAYLGLSTARVRTQADEGSKRAQLVLQLNERSDRLIAAILIINNIVNIAFTAVLALLLLPIHGPAAGIGLTILIASAVILFIGEITPKAIGRERAEAIAASTAPFLRGVMLVLTPLTFLFAQWQKLLAKLFRSEGSAELSEAEFMTLIEEIEEAGTINTSEGEFIRRAVGFTEIPVDAVMTPRPDVVAIAFDATDEEVHETFTESGYSRLPVYQEDIDRIVGILHIKRYMETPDQPLREAVEPALFVPENTKINRLLRQMQRDKFHLAIVLDEYGGTAGIITLEDILEELIGEIWDESDEVSEEIVRLSETEFQFAGGFSIDKFFRLMNLEEETSSTTLSGWLIDGLGDFPEEGQEWENDAIYVRITSVDRHRIATAYVRRKAANDDKTN